MKKRVQLPTPVALFVRVSSGMQNLEGGIKCGRSVTSQTVYFFGVLILPVYPLNSMSDVSTDKGLTA